MQVKIIESPRPTADVVFVLDVTASMQWAIDDLRNGIGSFARSLEKSNIDFRLGLVTFQDITIPGEKITVVQFKGGPFTGDSETFREAMAGLKASGGGDIPETSLEAIAEAVTMPYRKDATKVLLLITDAPPKPVKGTEAAVAKTAKELKDHQFDSVNIVVTRFDLDVYKPLLSAGVGKTAGSSFDLGDVVRGDQGFEALFAAFGTRAVTNAAIAKNPDARPRVAPRSEAPVIAEIKSLQSGETSVAGSESALVLRSAVWTAAIAGLIGLALAAGQQYYLCGTRPGLRDASFSLVGGCIVGLIGGAAGQALFFLAPASETLAIAFRILGWIILGGLAGAGLSFFIPNMKWRLGLAGGAIGGAAGAIAFMAAANATGDLVGRLLGGLVLGFFIGLMVAIAEAAFRQAWLDVRFSERESIRVTLGPEPVKLGGDAKACTIWAKGAPPVALRFFIREGQVICDDKLLGKEMAVPNGFTKAVGTLNVTVNSGSGLGTLSAPPIAAPPTIPAKASGPPPLGGAKAPPPLAKPAIAAPPTAKALPPIMPAKPPTIPQPLPPKPAAPPPIPQAESEGCPSCGRKQSGPPRHALLHHLRPDFLVRLWFLRQSYVRLLFAAVLQFVFGAVAVVDFERQQSEAGRAEPATALSHELIVGRPASPLRRRAGLKLDQRIGHAVLLAGGAFVPGFPIIAAIKAHDLRGVVKEVVIGCDCFAVDR